MHNRNLTFKHLIGIPQSYTKVIFLDHPSMGILFLFTTFWFPNIGTAGLLAATIGFLTAHQLEFPQVKSGMHIFNSLLVGLSLGAFYNLSWLLFVFIAFGAVFSVLLTTVIADFLSKHNGLPVLCLPFIVVAFIMAVVARNSPGIDSNLELATTPITWLGPIIDNFFSSFGAVFFSPHPVTGAIIFVCLLLRSRYLALLALAGYVAGYSVLMHFEMEVYPRLLMWTGFNFALTAIALGGIYTVPSIPSFVYAMVGSVLTAFFVIAMKDLLLIYSLPVMALPFVSITLLMLMALKTKKGFNPPVLAQIASMPETNYERARIAKYRNGDLNSVPILVPFYGEWQVYQGFSGSHTHQSHWRHALDFIVTKNGVSYRGDGRNLDDYHCYKLPILSPVFGEVVRIQGQLPDNAPGEVDAVANWGNFVLIRLQSGLHVLLAHLACRSLKVREGDRLRPGDIIGACGNSGRSPQPHLHVQVQHDAQLGGDTHPFHLASVILSKEKHRPRYQVVSVPKTGQNVQSARENDRLSSYLHLPVGRKLQFELQGDTVDGIAAHELHVELTLFGQFRLAAENGASSGFEEQNGVLAFYDRNKVKNMLLDIWVLANGLTPMSEQASIWKDSLSANLLPLTLTQKLLVALLCPLGRGLASEYEREWNNEKAQWHQTATHVLDLGVVRWKAVTKSVIDPRFGCVEVSMKFNNYQWCARLIDTGLKNDQGIPGWKENRAQKLLAWGCQSKEAEHPSC